MSTLKKLFQTSIYIISAFAIAMALCMFTMTYAEYDDDEEEDTETTTTENWYDETTETSEITEPTEITETTVTETEPPITTTTTEQTEETTTSSSSSETDEITETEPTIETDISTDESSLPTDEPPVAPPELQLNISYYSLYVGEGVQLTAQLVNSTIENPVISYYSNNTEVARVDASGYIIATGIGQTEIVAYCEDLSATVIITVIEEEVKPEFIVLAKSEFLLKTGATAQIEAELLPKEIAENYSFTYSSLDEAIATVDENGIITAVSEGETEITVSAGDLSEKVYVKVSSETFYETAKIEGYLYNSKGEAMAGSVVSIDNQTATVDKSGYFCFDSIDQKNVTIFVSDYPNVKCDFKVTKDETIYLLSSESALIRVASIYEMQGMLPISQVKFDSKNLLLIEGDVYSLNYTFSPEGATVTEIKYESSNPLVAQVGQIDGVISAKSAGAAVITLTLNGGQASVQLNVTVNPQESTKYSILIVVIEGVLFLAAGVFIFIFYRRYKLKAESNLEGDEDEDDEDLHDFE